MIVVFVVKLFCCHWFLWCVCVVFVLYICVSVCGCVLDCIVAVVCFYCECLLFCFWCILCCSLLLCLMCCDVLFMLFLCVVRCVCWYFIVAFVAVLLMFVV